MLVTSSGIVQPTGAVATQGVFDAALRAVPQDQCFVCGPDHPHGLRIRYSADPEGGATADWTPTPAWEGFRGIIHGGILATVLDEAMSKAVGATRCEALTVALRVRFRRHVVCGEPLRIRAWVVKRTKRLIATEATLTSSDGVECAHARASFLALPRRRVDG